MSGLVERFPVGMVLRAPFGHIQAGETYEITSHYPGDLVFSTRHLTGGINAVDDTDFVGFTVVYDPRYPFIYGERESVRVCRRADGEHYPDLLPGHWLYQRPKPIPLARRRALEAAAE
jgi:hypothetical protein